MNLAIVAAAGEGSRFGLAAGKQFVDLSGRPLLAYSIEALQQSEEVNGIVIVTNRERVDFCRDRIVKRFAFNKVVDVIAGGDYRQESVYLGLISLPPAVKKVIIHDGARPLIETKKIDEVIAACPNGGGAILAIPVTDTVKLAGENNEIVETIDRDRLWLAQTPQVFDYAALIEAHEKAKKDGFVGTDDASLMERLGHKIKIVSGGDDNLKITTPRDLVAAEVILSERISA